MEGFVPDDHDDSVTIPFWEDASNTIGVKGYSSTKTIKALESEIRKAMGFLGGTINGIQSGTIPWKGADGNIRYAFRIFFTYMGAEGRIDIAALPIQKETPARVKQARRHALYSVMLRLEGMFNSILTMPGDMPLVPYMMNESGQTMVEFLQLEGKVPKLQAPPEGQVDENGETVEGEFREANGE